MSIWIWRAEIREFESHNDKFDGFYDLAVIQSSAGRVHTKLISCACMSQQGRSIVDPKRRQSILETTRISLINYGEPVLREGQKEKKYRKCKYRSREFVLENVIACHEFRLKIFG